MKNLIITLLTACLVVGVICLALQTALPDHFWLWLAGLAGPVIAALQFVLRHVRRLFDYDEQPIRPSVSQRTKKIRTL